MQMQRGRGVAAQAPNRLANRSVLGVRGGIENGGGGPGALLQQVHVNMYVCELRRCSNVETQRINRPQLGQCYHRVEEARVRSMPLACFDVTTHLIVHDNMFPGIYCKLFMSTRLWE